MPKFTDAQSGLLEDRKAIPLTTVEETKAVLARVEGGRIIEVTPEGEVFESEMVLNRQVEPVETLEEAAPYLRRPFTPNAVKFKALVAYPKSNPDKAFVASYIDARLVVERLNLVVPGFWQEGDVTNSALPAFEPIGEGLLLCRLSVCGIPRSDVGSGYKGKGLYSDALKRAAVKFGVGVSLYAVPRITVYADQGHCSIRSKGEGKGHQVYLNDSGHEYCRAFYADWLQKAGRLAFGDPLDHGDVLGAVGDAEEIEAPEGEPDPAAAEAAEKGAEALRAGLKKKEGKS